MIQQSQNVAVRYQNARGQLYALRGWAALEAGQLEKAEYLSRAQAIGRESNTPSGWEHQIDMGLKWLNDNAKPQD